ncbi:MAG: response regulator [Rhodospirillales bacterium]
MANLDLAAYSILLVDDVAFARRTVMRLFRGMGAPTVHQAVHGAQALKFLKSGKPVDFVIADFNMPKFNGLQLLKAVRTGAAGVDRSMPVAFLTGFSDKHLVNMALALDVNAFLLKPVSKKTLSQRLEKMLARGENDPWLKPATFYDGIAIEDAMAEATPVKENLADRAPAPRATTRHTEPEPRPRELDPRHLAARTRVMRRLSSLRGKFEESDLAQNISRSVDVLMSTNGEKAASRIVSYLDGLVKREILELDDLPDVLSTDVAELPVIGVETRDADAPKRPPDGKLFFPLVEVPGNAVLSRNLHTEDGSLFMIRGTMLTPQIVSILVHLEKRGVLALESGPGGKEGVYVRIGVETRDDERKAAAGPAAAAAGNERQVRLDKLLPGAVLSRDIFTADGRLYLQAGAQLSERMVSIIQDLDELGHMQSQLWIVS